MSSSTTYDPLDPVTLADPYSVLSVIRDSTPVFWHESMRCWVLTRYADCVAVLRDHHHFARDRRRAGPTVPDPSLSVQSLDPPEQSQVRSLFTNALRAQDISGLERRAHARIDALLREVREHHSFDVMADLAVPLSVSVISDVLGVDEPDVATFATISDTIMRSMDAGLDPDVAEPGRVARQELSALVESWFHSSGRPGVLSYVKARYPGETDTDIDVYVRNTARVMFQGGYSTMVAAVGNAVHTLMGNPGALDRMRDPRTLHTGVDELVRYDGPVQGTSRIATAPNEIAGKRVRAGETVLVLFAAANRDASQFLRPDALILNRSPNQHLGYGWGTHSCLGSVPAQAALRAVVSSLGRQSMPLRAAGVPRRRRTATMRVFDVLPATFRP